MSPKFPLAILVVAAIAVPAIAVGLGPLQIDGVIDGPREGFSLDLSSVSHAPTGSGGEDSIETASGTRCRRSINSSGA